MTNTDNHLGDRAGGTSRDRAAGTSPEGRGSAEGGTSRDRAAGAVAMDRIFDAVALRGPVCVGLDTAIEHLPPSLRSTHSSRAEAMFAYNEALIEATADYAACYKVQIAYYEELGLEGLRAYARTLEAIRRSGRIAIADIKRGDIADTASRYALAHFTGEFEADCVTLNPYMGLDSLEPWLEAADKFGKGLFALVRTSNPGMRDFEGLALQKGGHVYDEVAARVAGLASRGRGERGYGTLGAVVGCTERDEAAELRARLGGVFILIPGYGAQGGGAEDAALLLVNGNGGIVNASRSILKAWAKSGRPADSIGIVEAAEAARMATLQMRDAIAQAVRSLASPR